MSGLNILVAEDEAVSRELIVNTLQRLGHQVIVTTDGEEAWEVFGERHDIQVVISDWLMPNMDGPTLCQLVRAERRPRYTYFILLTILQGKENKLQGMEAGADDFISKPFDPDELAARLVAAARVLELRYEVAQLECLLPICCYCKKIRNDDHGWMAVEEYIARHTGTDFSHGICPHCYEDVVKPELKQLDDRRRGDRPQGSGDSQDRS